MVTDASTPILQPGRTCAERLRADRFAVLVDGAAYFRALAHSLVEAERQVLIAGWDLDPDFELWRGEDPGPPPPPRPAWMPDAPLPSRLGPFLDELVRRRRRLRCLVLTWDIGTVFAVRRQVVPVYHLDWTSHRRVVVRLDGEHPLGASMHVKAVAIDDTVGYVGGLDLTRYRWDRPGHDPDDPLRVSPGGQPYPPWHDQQACFSGPAAQALGRMLRTRWRHATRRRVPAPVGMETDPWPQVVEPDLREVELALLRTEPPFDGRDGVREIESAWLEAVRQARELITIENQYLTANSIAEALARRLAEPDGPAVVITTSARSSGFLEQAVMDGHRAHFLETLRQADQHGRLRVYTVQSGPGVPVKIHAKATIFDDRYLQLGSANLANRSMALDPELDIGLEALGPNAEAVRRFLRQHRHALFAEHLGVEPEEIPRAAHAHGGFLAGLDALARTSAEGPRGLRPLPELAPALEVPAIFGDPEDTVDMTDLAHRLVPDGLPRSLLGGGIRLMAGLVMVSALEAVWHGLPAGVSEDPERMRLWLRSAELEPLSVGAMVAAFVGASIVPFPMSLLIFAAGVAFGTGGGATLAIVGTAIGVHLGWVVGRIIGRRHIDGLGIPRLNAISRRLRQPGLVSIAELRLSPRHTFAEVNLVAGALQTSLRDLVPGSIIGGLPGVFLTAWFGHLAAEAMRRPDSTRVLSAVLVLAFILALTTLLWRRTHPVTGPATLDARH